MKIILSLLFVLISLCIFANWFVDQPLAIPLDKMSKGDGFAFCKGVYEADEEIEGKDNLKLQKIFDAMSLFYAIIENEKIVLPQSMSNIMNITNKFNNNRINPHYWIISLRLYKLQKQGYNERNNKNEIFQMNILQKCSTLEINSQEILERKILIP